MADIEDVVHFVGVCPVLIEFPNRMSRSASVGGLLLTTDQTVRLGEYL